MNEALVFQIQRFCTHDGPGVRTTVFLKGCPLRCAWCHNPESQRFEKELSYSPALCIGCGACVQACPAGAHRIVEGRHVLDRSRCQSCFRCVQACSARALEAVGREQSIESIMKEVESDRVYYEETGGGLTVSGGEPLAHFPFIYALLAEAHKRKIHTCVETSGYAPPNRVLSLLDVVDLFLWDIKDTEPIRHQAMTGVSLDTILDNLRLVDEAGGHTRLRCILVDGVNMAMPHIEGVARLALSLKHCQGLALLPYHPMGDAKLERIGRTRSGLNLGAPFPKALDEARARLADLGVACFDS